MATKLLLIAFVALPCACLYWVGMRSTPGKGLLKLSEKLFVGIAVVYLLNGILSPFQMPLAQNPLTSLAAGYLGLPGVVLAFLVQRIL